MITVGRVARYLLIMTTHSDAGCLTLLTRNHTPELVMESNLVLLEYSINVGDCKRYMWTLSISFSFVSCAEIKKSIITQ